MHRTYIFRETNWAEPPLWENPNVDMQDEKGCTALINATDNCPVSQDRDGKTVLSIGKKKWPVETCILSTSSGIYTQDRCFRTNLGV